MTAYLAPMDALGRCVDCGTQIISTGGGCPNSLCPSRRRRLMGVSSKPCSRCRGTGQEPEKDPLAEAVCAYVEAREGHDDATAGQMYFLMIDLASRARDP